MNRETLKRAAISIIAAVILWLIVERLSEPLSRNWSYFLAFVYLFIVCVMFLWTIEGKKGKTGGRNL